MLSSSAGKHSSPGTRYHKSNAVFDGIRVWLLKRCSRWWTMPVCSDAVTRYHSPGGTTAQSSTAVLVCINAVFDGIPARMWFLR